MTTLVQTFSIVKPREESARVAYYGRLCKLETRAFERAWGMQRREVAALCRGDSAAADRFRQRHAKLTERAWKLWDAVDREY